MPMETTNYKLKKQQENEIYDVDLENANLDIIDAVLNAVSDNGALKRADIIDNVTSTAVDLPLSANQGRALKTAIDGKVDTSDISHTTNCVEENKVAGAKQLNASIEGTYAAAVEKKIGQSKTTIAETITKEIQGFIARTTTFNADGSIMETGTTGTKITVFNANGSITETFLTISGEEVTKTTVFNTDGSISEVIA